MGSGSETNWLWPVVSGRYKTTMGVQTTTGARPLCSPPLFLSCPFFGGSGPSDSFLSRTTTSIKKRGRERGWVGGGLPAVKKSNSLSLPRVAPPSPTLFSSLSFFFNLKCCCLGKFGSEGIMKERVEAAWMGKLKKMLRGFLFFVVVVVVDVVYFYLCCHLPCYLFVFPPSASPLAGTTTLPGLPPPSRRAFRTPRA